jgi:hypothetical protein
MDSEDCRTTAADCMEMANAFENGRAQSMLLDIAAAWTKLADGLDESKILRNAVRGA